MISKTLLLKTLFLALLFTNNPIKSMKETDNKKDFLEQNISLIETIPNELLLSIFYSIIEEIVNTYDADKAIEKFKIFLSSIRLINKRFYEFEESLKKYFIGYQKDKMWECLVFAIIRNSSKNNKDSFEQAWKTSQDIKDNHKAKRAAKAIAAKWHSTY